MGGAAYHGYCGGVAYKHPVRLHWPNIRSDERMRVGKPGNRVGCLFDPVWRRR